MSPAIRASICTGEQTAGFISRETGAFTGVMLINSPEDRKRFCKEFGIKDIDIKIIY
ncbi:MAG TPA: aspartate dehydrogenase [Candidatus Faecivivens stercorigallinarum]|nr:aspartate dehydrogenase [Candidatus Faecivivens stercorigallinarum]